MLLRVMTYNILNGGERREHLLSSVIQAARPDVVVLQEVFTAEFLTALARSLDMTSFFGAGNRQRRVALLSRFPIHSPHSHHPPFPTWRNVVEAEIEIRPGQTFRLLGVHPIASLSVACEVWRLWEARYVIRRSQRYANEDCLIAGDFNAIAPGDDVRVHAMPTWLKQIIWLQGNRVYRFSIRAFLAAGFTDCFRHLHSTGGGFTLPPPDPNSRLDYIFVNAKMKARLKTCWVVREPDAVTQASDHYPVMAEFDFAS